mmetsp:Transcript_30254/g.63324  ORF Transcript_30254/g.63324 Transcript_30254/m.63324 type:complete len:546 (-) Transcript_30254:2086-3723(-)
MRQQQAKKQDILDDSDDSDLDLMGDRNNSNSSSKTRDSGKRLVRNGDVAGKQPLSSAAKAAPIDLLSSSPDSARLGSERKAAPASTSSGSTAAAAAAATAKRIQSIGCSSSDDDDDDSDTEDPARSSARSRPPLPANLPPDIASSLRQAQQAKAKLASADAYHADDVHVTVKETVYVPTARPVAAAKPPSALLLGASAGKTLRVTCRCLYMVIGGTRTGTPKEKQTSTLVVREKETLSCLRERFCEVHGLPVGSAKIVMNFDGLPLDVTKTPAFYEMGDEDLVDVSASATALLAPSGGTASVGYSKTPGLPGVPGKRLLLNCRVRTKSAANKKTEMVEKLMALYENNPLGTIAKRLCGDLGATRVVMTFDGCVLDTEKSPRFYEMEDEDMIDVTAEKEEDPDPQPDGNSNSTITLVVQQRRGRTKTNTRLVLSAGDALSKLMEEFKRLQPAVRKSSGTTRRSTRATANNSTDHLFLFRGQKLDPSKTPGDYEMEEGDEIDVIESVAKKAALPKQTRASKRASAMASSFGDSGGSNNNKKPRYATI